MSDEKPGKCCNPDQGLVNVMHHAAVRFNKRGWLAEAETMFKNTIAAIERCFGSDNESMIRCKMDLGEFYKDHQRYEEAEALAREALTLSVKVLGPYHVITGGILNNIAEIQTALGQFGEADIVFRQALEVLDVEPCPQPEWLPAVLGSYAGLLRKTNRAQEAEGLEARIKSLTSSPTA